ncbi:MAG: hypothetical protein COV44_07355 [Deltaproteobacteria bacterium CG11_big_fil_rev_8_21_14_0_20_45_16]|nr:MAG: hypothetical protein COV44_07355 [Deltaproteobacteria bacterium CG11_big_fil_rev_8_21_14_0_20_45_16]
MKFDWDPEKAKANLSKHKISFALATTVFDDPIHLSIPDPDWKGEERWVSIGMASNTQTLVVVHTDRLRIAEEEVIRIISARKATRKERKEYEERI